MVSTLKQRLHRKGDSGEYDTIHLETSADLVLMPDGETCLTDEITEIDNRISNIPNRNPPHALGEIFTWEGYEWLVVHIGKRLMFMITNDILSLTDSGKWTYDKVNYADSTLASLAAAMENSLSDEAKSHLAVINTYGVNARVFVPTWEQCGLGSPVALEGCIGFDLFTSNASRYAKYNGTITEWWTSSHVPVDGVLAGKTVMCNVYIDDEHSGSAGYGSTHSGNGSRGFRPCVAYKF